ncbi:hypothetical protein Q7P37_001147 [Cladosporium fusiforme]
MMFWKKGTVCLRVRKCPFLVMILAEKTADSVPDGNFDAIIYLACDQNGKKRVPKLRHERNAADEDSSEVQHIRAHATTESTTCGTLTRRQNPEIYCRPKED